jgi:hypothetical protein
VELAKGYEVIDPVLATAQPLGGLGDVQPRRDGRSTGRDESSGALGYLDELLVREPDSQLDHRYDPPFATRDLLRAVLPLCVYDREHAKTAM